MKNLDREIGGHALKRVSLPYRIEYVIMLSKSLYTSYQEINFLISESTKILSMMFFCSLSDSPGCHFIASIILNSEAQRAAAEIFNWAWYTSIFRQLALSSLH
jgi:hypothetical protein